MDVLKGRNVRVREGQWHYRFNFRGREYSGPTGLAGVDSNQNAAEEFAAARKVELKRSRPQAVVARTAVALTAAAPFRTAAEAFLGWAKDVEYRSKPSTAERIRISFQSLLEFFGDTPMSAIDAAAIEAYKEHRIRVHEVRDVTVRHDLHALSVFFRKYAVPRGTATRNPVGRGPDGVRQVGIPSDRDAVRDHILTAAEEAKYFTAAAKLHALHCKQVKAAQPNMADLARLILEQGARPEELLSARVEVFDSAAKTLRIECGKTRAARRTLYLTPVSVGILERRVQLGSEWLFPSERHPGHHLGQLNTTHDRVCRNAGVAFRVYDFRHTFATRAIDRGVPVAVVAAILGHSNLRSIHRYVHPTADAQREAMDRYAAGKVGPKAVGE